MAIASAVHMVSGAKFIAIAIASTVQGPNLALQASAVHMVKFSSTEYSYIASAVHMGFMKGPNLALQSTAT